MWKRSNLHNSSAEDCESIVPLSVQRLKSCTQRELFSIEERMLAMLSQRGRPSGRRGWLTGKPSAEWPCGSKTARGARLERLMYVQYCLSWLNVSCK